MRTDQAITEIIEDYLDIQDDSNIAVAQNDPLRVRTLRCLQKGANWAYTLYNWTWRQAPEPIDTPASGYYVTLPLNFEQPGQHMTIFFNKRELKRRNPGTISRLVNERPKIGVPEIWCPVSFFDDEQGLTSDVANIYPGVPDDSMLVLDKFMTTPPQLADGETGSYLDPEGSSFNRFPVTVQQNVLIPYAASLMMKHMGDAREQSEMAKAQAAVAAAWKEDVPQNRGARAPRYGRGHRYR